MTKIGFFQEDTGIVHEIPKALFDSQSATAIKVSLLAGLRAITAAPGLWWVRVFAPKNNPSDTTSEWSEIKSGTTLKTIPFEVGESFLRCRGVASGSFGDLILPRKDVTSGSWTAMNIAAGAQKEPRRTGFPLLLTLELRPPFMVPVPPRTFARLVTREQSIRLPLPPIPTSIRTAFLTGLV